MLPHRSQALVLNFEVVDTCTPIVMQLPANLPVALLDGNTEFEMQSLGSNRGRFDDFAVEVLEPSAKERLFFFLLGGVAFVLGIAVIWFTVNEFLQETNYRVWLLFAFLAPISMLYSHVWSILSNYYLEQRFISITIESMQSPLLYSALAAKIQDIAETRSITSSSDMRAYTEYDKSIGRVQVRMQYWGSRSRSIRMRLHGFENASREVIVQFTRGEDVVCGRDQAVQNREQLTLLVRASHNRLADKQCLKNWLDICVDKYREPPTGLVEVMALDQSSIDWVPEWKTRCVRPMKSSAGTGHAFFLQRGCANRMVADACTWFERELRIYLITGPPGVGKTELTIWLAGFFKVPLYRIALNDSRLTDQLFAQLVSPTSLKHDNSVIQIDEFQETLKRWQVESSSGQGVSMGGFCEVLQGSNSLARGFIVLSGTQELLETMQDPVFAAVFRRISQRATLSWLQVEDTRAFFISFLKVLVPSCSPELLSKNASDFTRDASVWNGSRKDISIDMIKQYLMQRISGFRAEFLSQVNLAPNVPFHIPHDKYESFFKWVNDSAAAKAYLLAYAPVGAHGSPW